MEKTLNVVRKYSIFIVLLVLVAFFACLNPVFISIGNLINITRQVSYLGIGCVGAMCCMLTGGIDLSLGSAVTMNNILIAFLMVKLGVHPVLACLAGVVMNTAIGYINGYVVSTFNMPALIVTLSTQLILEGAAYILAKGMPIFGFPEGFNFIGQGYVGPIPFCVILLIICMLIGAFLLNKTYFGKYFFAVGSNAQASQLSGINVKQIQRLSYSLSGFFGGICGIVLLSRTNSGQVTAGKGFEFDVISALVVGGVSVSGGTGKMSRALIGVLIMGVLNNGFVIIGVSTYMQSVIKGFILLLAVGFDCVQRANKAKTIKTKG